MKKSMLRPWSAFSVIFCALLGMAAADEKIPQDVKDRPDFFAKMDMIENVTAIASLDDNDLQIVMNTKSNLPTAAKLEDLQEKPQNKDEDNQ